MEDNTLICAHYPFLKRAKEFLQETDVTLEELLEEDKFLSARENGIKRVEHAIKHRKIPEPHLLFNSEVEILFEILSYVVGRLLVAKIGIDSLTRVYALAEATTYQQRLEKEEEPTLVLEILSEAGLEIMSVESTSQPKEPRFAVPFNQYLRFTKRIKDPHWKLVNQEMEKGMVFLNKKRLTRLVRELLFDKFYREIKEMPGLDITNSFLKKEMQRLKNIYLAMKENVETKELGTVDIENIPPCMRNLLIHLQHGENVPHAGRFALTAFLHKIGFTNQEILNLHKNAPDFDEKLAAYQIDHITGKISSTEYTPQSCSTMDNLGLCVNRDLLCSKIIHPLGYYHAKNEAHRPARIREKRYVDFLVSYFSLMEKKDEKALGRHIMEAVHKAELFGEEKKKGKMLNENSQKEWNLIELKFLTGEKGFIKTLKLEDEKGVRYVLYAELRATDSRGKMVRFLPTLDMALAMKIFERRGKWVKALCRDIPLFKKRYLYLHAIYKESNGHLHGKI